MKSLNKYVAPCAMEIVLPPLEPLLAGSPLKPEGGAGGGTGGGAGNDGGIENLNSKPTFYFEDYEEEEEIGYSNHSSSASTISLGLNDRLGD